MNEMVCHSAVPAMFHVFHISLDEQIWLRSMFYFCTSAIHHTYYRGGHLNRLQLDIIDVALHRRRGMEWINLPLCNVYA